MLIEPFIYEDTDKYLILKAFFDQEGERFFKWAIPASF